MDSFRISYGRRCDRSAVFDQISISKPFQLQDPVKCSGVSLNIGQNLTHRPKHLAILYTDSPSMKAIFSCGLALLVAHSCPNPGKQPDDQAIFADKHPTSRSSQAHSVLPPNINPTNKRDISILFLFTR